MSCGQAGDGRFCRICDTPLGAIPAQTPAQEPTQLLSPMAAAQPVTPAAGFDQRLYGSSNGGPENGALGNVAEQTRMIPPVEAEASYWTATAEPVVQVAQTTQLPLAAQLPQTTQLPQGVQLPQVAQTLQGGYQPTTVIPQQYPGPASTPQPYAVQDPQQYPVQATQPFPSQFAPQPQAQPFSQPLQPQPLQQPPASAYAPTAAVYPPTAVYSQAPPSYPPASAYPAPPAHLPPTQPPGYSDGPEYGEEDPSGTPKAVIYGTIGAIVVAIGVIGGLLYLGTPNASSPAAATTPTNTPVATQTTVSQVQLPPAPPTTAPPTTTPPPQMPTGAITGYQGLCVDDQSGSTSNSNPVQVVTCDNSAEQQWSVGAGNTVQIFNMCLDVNGGGTTDGTTVDLYTCNSTGAQVWQPQSNNTLVNPQSGKCLDDTAFGGSGTQLQIWDCGGGPNQQWTLP
jgi:Ricin-type beta-trefoil lectin domain